MEAVECGLVHESIGDMDFYLGIEAADAQDEDSDSEEGGRLTLMRSIVPGITLSQFIFPKPVLPSAGGNCTVKGWRSSSCHFY